MRKRDESKEQSIREKALKMFVKEGFDGFSMQKLAKAANVSPATIYIYYKDKEDLIFQLYEFQGKKMLGAMMEDFNPSMSFSEGLRLQWLNRNKYYMNNIYEMLFLDQIKNSPLLERAIEASSDDYKSIMQSFKSAMTEFIDNAIKNNELVKVQFEVFWTMAYAPLYSLLRIHASGSSIGGIKFIYSDEIMESTLQLVLKALKPT